MSLFPDSSAAWAALVIVVLPLLIIGAGELVERMRQRDSPFQPAVSTVRVWVVPLLTVWMVARALFDVATDNIFLRFLGSAIILSGATAALSALRVVAADLADRPRRTGRRPIPAAARAAATAADPRDPVGPDRRRVGRQPVRRAHRARRHVARDLVRPPGHPQRYRLGIHLAGRSAVRPG